MKEKLYKIDGDEILIKKLNPPMSWFAIAMTWNKKIYHQNLWQLKDITIRHEMIHVKQQTTLGWRKFLGLYLYQWFKRFSYKNNLFEKEARALQNTYRGWSSVTKDSWKNYKQWTDYN